MIKMEKAVANVGGTSDGTQIGELGSTTESNYNFIMDAWRAQGRIEGMLWCGERNGIGLKELCKITGMSERAVRAQIRLERLNGAPILSNNKDGYFLPGSAHELKMCVRSLRGRAAEIQRTADALELRGGGIDGESKDGGFSLASELLRGDS